MCVHGDHSSSISVLHVFWDKVFLNLKVTLRLDVSFPQGSWPASIRGLPVSVPPASSTGVMNTPFYMVLRIWIQVLMLYPESFCQPRKKLFLLVNRDLGVGFFKIKTNEIIYKEVFGSLFKTLGSLFNIIPEVYIELLSYAHLTSISTTGFSYCLSWL